MSDFFSTLLEATIHFQNDFDPNTSSLAEFLEGGLTVDIASEFAVSTNTIRGDSFSLSLRWPIPPQKFYSWRL